MRLYHYAGAMLALLATTMPAQAIAPGIGVDSGQFTIGISGFVPVICRASVEVSMAAPDNGMVQLGSLKEFCNSPNGYRVHADFSASLNAARLVVDGEDVSLDQGGSVVVSESDRAAIDTHDLTLVLPEGTQTGSLSFRIEPL